MEDLSIFITAHITNEIHNIALNLCISNVRNHYKDNKIIVINDNSPSFSINIKDVHNKELITVINSEIKGAGEFLFLYYYHKLENPTKKALYIHDSMFLISPIPEEMILNLTDMKFLFSFSNKYKIKEQEKFISKLNEGSKINKNQNWVGCFGGSCIITHEYLKKLQNKYNILSLVPLITCRSEREIYERIIGSVVSYDLLNETSEETSDETSNETSNETPEETPEETSNNKKISVYGDLDEYFQKYPTDIYHNFRYYLNTKREDMPPILKLNFGR